MATTTNILLTYTGRDADRRSLLVAAARAARLPVRFVEVPGVVADPRARQALCAARLQHCDAAIVLISPEAAWDPGVASDLAAVRAAGLPLYGVLAGAEGAAGDARRTARRWNATGVVPWAWPRIAALLQRLPRQPDPRRIAC